MTTRELADLAAQLWDFVRKVLGSNVSQDTAYAEVFQAVLMPFPFQSVSVGYMSVLVIFGALI
jgi:hypothetical protein